MKSRVDIVTSYYEFVDSEAYDELFSLFSEDIIYYRPGHKPIEGKDEFETFYLQNRAIEGGSHELLEVLEDDSFVAVMGSFDGILAGENISITYADFFKFDGSNKITERYTYTDQGSV